MISSSTWKISCRWRRCCGDLDCNGYTAFKLAVRAEKACKLEVKAYHSDKALYHGVFPLGNQWQELVIRFDGLRDGDGSFDSTRQLLKVELQPSPDHQGRSLYLDSLGLPTHQRRSRRRSAARDVGVLQEAVGCRPVTGGGSEIRLIRRSILSWTTRTVTTGSARSSQPRRQAQPGCLEGWLAGHNHSPASAAVLL